MKVLITGANGLVGSAIAKQFVSESHEVFALCRAESDLSLLYEIKPKIQLVEGDVLDILSLEKAIENVDYVIHTAAIVSFSPKERQKMYQVNIEGTANVVNVCLAKNTKKLLFVSSVAAIGRPNLNLVERKKVFNINENQKWEESPLNSHYGKSKYLAENEVWRGEAEGLNIVVLNPSIILGEGDWNRSSTQLFKYIYDGSPFYTAGTLNYVDIKDVAEIAYKLTLSEIKNERFILNAGSISYKDFFDKIADNFQKKRPKWQLKIWMIQILWRLEAFRGFLTGKSPLITKETAQTAQNHFFYQNEKVVSALDHDFQQIDESIRRVCNYLSQKQLDKN